jgi:addiction module RelB/DinJ family antitoxin
MAKTSSIYTRVEPDIKEKAEQVLSSLGIPMANAINLFLYQVVLQRGIPFDVKMPKNRPLDYPSLSQGQFDAEMEKAVVSLDAGRVHTSRQVREKVQRLYSQ